MDSQELKKKNIPDKPGVYFFKKGNHILYIGKATSLKDRVKSYFSNDLLETRGPIFADLLNKIDNIDWQTTDSVLEALILESKLIKRYQPKLNSREKDNKSFNFVCITKEKLPKVLTIRERSIKNPEQSKNVKFSATYGPFPNGGQLKEALKLIRRIFPFVDRESNVKNYTEFYKQLGLVPEALDEYKKNIRNIKLLFQGKKKSVVINLRKEMKELSKAHKFESAAKKRDQIFALEHINDVALIKTEHIDENYIIKNKTPDFNIFRIEAYDVAHMSGKNMVGVMTVVENKHANKNEYRKFNIRTQDGANDTGALEEVLARRLRHIEWGLPHLIVVDGGIQQVNVAKRVTDRFLYKTPIVGVVKDEKHRPKMIIGDKFIIKEHERDILMANSEAHRFAITFHKQKRRKSFIGK